MKNVLFKLFALLFVIIPIDALAHGPHSFAPHDSSVLDVAIEPIIIGLVISALAFFFLNRLLFSRDNKKKTN